MIENFEGFEMEDKVIITYRNINSNIDVEFKANIIDKNNSSIKLRREKDYKKLKVNSDGEVYAIGFKGKLENKIGINANICNHIN